MPYFSTRWRMISWPRQRVPDEVLDLGAQPLAHLLVHRRVAGQAAGDLAAVAPAGAPADAMGLDQGHLVATLGQFDRRGDAGEAAADDGDVDRHRAQQGRIVGFLVERGGVVGRRAFRGRTGMDCCVHRVFLVPVRRVRRRAAVCGRVRGGSGLGQVPAPVLLADLAHGAGIPRASPPGRRRERLAELPAPTRSLAGRRGRSASRWAGACRPGRSHCPPPARPDRCLRGCRGGPRREAPRRPGRGWRRRRRCGARYADWRPGRPARAGSRCGCRRPRSAPAARSCWPGSAGRSWRWDRTAGASRAGWRACRRPPGAATACRRGRRWRTGCGLVRRPG